MDQKTKKSFQEIVERVQSKASLKQAIYRNTLESFERFKACGEELVEKLRTKMDTFDKDVQIEYKEIGEFEFQIKVGGDVILFYMHSNVFDFDPSHPIKQSAYVKEDTSRSYCGVINIYNFLSDSFKYSRYDDSGYLIGRAFINKDKHFFMEGKRQLNFIYNNFVNDTIDKACIREVIHHAILYSMDFDLFTPPYRHVQEMSVGQLLQEASGMRMKTSKRLGFRFSFDDGEGENQFPT
ncbi:MAG: hypothetical protein CMC96_06415 [Flavobacteriales bacterium]|nr:hypothetical protein [Flavobacteriales bacterium]|tara:strand:+ start:5167 stop:5880 length:714 start_codon:yes stop_codon:yes gene_type:complete